MTTTNAPILWCLAGLLTLGCNSSQDSEPHAGAEGEQADTHEITLSLGAIESAGIALQPVSLRTVEPTVETTGRLGYDERRMAVATARMGGRISSVVADYGARVAAGDVLAWIDSPELGAAQAKYRQAAAVARVREAEYERAKLLLEGQAISRGELLRRDAEWQSSRAELESSAQTLHLLGLTGRDIESLSAETSHPTTVYPVRAPIAGRVTERTVSVGQVVASDTRLFLVAELSELWLMLQLFEKDLPAVSVGSTVTLQCEAHPQDRFQGRIDFVADMVDPHSRTIGARAVIDNSDGKLKPGMFVYAEVARSDSARIEPQVLAVPLSAVVQIEDGDSVFAATGERTFERRRIRLGRRWGEWVEVIEGLAPGESVVVSGAFALKSETLKGGLEEHGH